MVCKYDSSVRDNATLSAGLQVREFDLNRFFLSFLDFNFLKSREYHWIAPSYPLMLSFL